MGTPAVRWLLDTVQLGHAHVGDDHVRDAVVDELQGFDAVAGPADLVAPPFQKAADHLLDHAIVVDEDYVLHRHQCSAVSLEAMARARSRCE
jgi:hypothetical protein